MLQLSPLIISAPFGNWLSFPGTTSTMGTFTNAYRGNLFYRLYRCLLTLRYHPPTRDEGWSWTNKLGLPNPGSKSVGKTDLRGKIVSVHGHDETSWLGVIEPLLYNPTSQALELNLGCPNVGHTPRIKDLESMLKRIGWARSGGWKDWLVIAKLPPVRWGAYIRPLLDYGIRTFHCCNTLPCPEGGRSGPPLKPYSLALIRELRDLHGDSLRIIGGGGISTPQDIRDYKEAGADHVAIASFLLNPFNWRKVPSLLKAVREEPSHHNNGGLNNGRVGLYSSGESLAQSSPSRTGEKQPVLQLRQETAEGGL